jgi:hypothetical protein
MAIALDNAKLFSTKRRESSAGLSDSLLACVIAVSVLKEQHCIAETTEIRI